MMYERTTQCFSILLLICLVFDTAEAYSNYDQTVLADSPVAYWPLDPSIPNDYSGNNLTGVYTNNPSAGSLPNNDVASVFNGVNQYFTIADNDYLEIVRTGILTIAAWFRPDTLQFVLDEGSGYVWWMGKGAANQQSWAARMYSYNNTEGRPNRISGYAFSLAGGLGAGSYFQDNVIIGQWIYYTLTVNIVNVSTPYPTGYTKIFKNGIERDQDALINYTVVPQNGTAPMRVATRQMQSFFQGAIGKVAVFDYELKANQLQTHYNCMVLNTSCKNATQGTTQGTTPGTSQGTTQGTTQGTSQGTMQNTTQGAMQGATQGVAAAFNTAHITWKSTIWFWVMSITFTSLLRW